MKNTYLGKNISGSGQFVTGLFSSLAIISYMRGDFVISNQVTRLGFLSLYTLDYIKEGFGFIYSYLVLLANRAGGFCDGGYSS